MSKIPLQFEKNLGILKQEEFKILSTKKVVLIGLGGLGGHLANGLARLGINSLYLVDYDKYSITNLNRQLFSNYENLNKFKAEVVEKELRKINPYCLIYYETQRIQKIDYSIFKNYDFIIDAVDNIETKLYIEEMGKKLNIPILHGACAGFYGQVAWIANGSNLLHDLYKDNKSGLEDELFNPYFTPSVVASVMLSELVKMIKDPKGTVVNHLILIDLYNNVITKTYKGDTYG